MKKTYLSLMAGLACSFSLTAQTVTTFLGTAAPGTPGQAIIPASTPFASATFAVPSSIYIDSVSGRTWITEYGGNRLRLLVDFNTPTTVYNRAGDGAGGNGGDADGTSAGVIRFNGPSGVIMAASGDLYIADRDNHCIRKITAYTTVGNPHTSSTFAGTKGLSGAGWADETGTAAQFNSPSDIVISATGDFYVADAGNNCIRKITAAGEVTTLAGNTTSGDVDGTGSAARFSNPMGLGWYSPTELIICDAGNAKIKKLNISTRVVTTIAGTGTSGNDDGDALTVATFTSPTDAAVDANGNIYVTDAITHVIRKITGSCVTTFAGSAGVNGTTNGTGTDARFDTPGSLFFYKGNLYVADMGNHTIRKVTASTTGIEAAPVAKFVNPFVQGYTNTTYTFRDSSTGTIGARIWRFTPNNVTYMNSTDSSSKNVEVQFTAKATYSVYLKVANCGGVSDKTTTLSIINVGIHELNSDQSLSVFPNPSNGMFEVTVDGVVNNGMSLRVTDVQGKVVYERQSISNKETVDLSGAAKGIYILTVSGKESSVVKKLVVE